MDFSYFHKINNMYNAKNKKETDLYNIKKQISLDFDKSLLTFPVKIQGLDRNVMIMDNSSKDKSKKIISKPNEPFNAGDIIEWNQSYWIVIEKEPIEEFYTKGVIKQCLETLKWLDSRGEVKETPFAIKFLSSAYNLQEDKVMILSTERRIILIQDNSYTKRIKKDQRFIFDDRAWKVIAKNGLQEGLIELTVEETEFNDAKDNKELRIADYKGNVAQYKVSILNGSSVSISDIDTLRLNVIVTNNDKYVDNPSLTYKSSDENVLTVDQNGLITPVQNGSASVTVSYEDVSSTIHVNVIQTMVNNYTAEITGVSEIKINQSATFSVKFFNNGIPISDTAIFSVVSDDGISATNLATITSFDKSSCIVKANSTLGFIRLKVVNQNGLIKNEVRIKIKSLI